MTVSVAPRLEAIAEMKITNNHPIRSASAPGHLVANNGDHFKSEFRKMREKRWRADAADTLAPPQHPDILTCGVCQKPFALGDIMKFIQHKVAACNKENYLSSAGEDLRHHQDGSDSDDPQAISGGQGGIHLPLGVVNTRRPSISAPISTKKSLVGSSTSSSAVRILCTPPPSLLDSDDPRCSTPIKRRGRSSSPLLRPASVPAALSNHLAGLLADEDDVRPALRQLRPGRRSLDHDTESMSNTDSSPEEARCKKLRIDVADAESNTINSEPNNYVCSTCKQRLHSAWRLVQHVQNSHGIKIYVDAPAGSSASPGDTAAKGASVNSTNRSSSSTCSASPSSSACSSGGGPVPGVATPLSLPLPPPRLPPHHSGPPSSPLLDTLHHPFGVGGLLRMPTSSHHGGHHPFPPSSPLGLAHSPLFPRPSSHDHFRMDQLVSEQFRLSQQSLGLAAAAAASAAGAGTPVTSIAPPPVSPFGPTSTSVAAPTSTPSRPTVNLEPQMDFYSQRLRQLAGTTSPGAASVANGSASSPSPRKAMLTPPFGASSTPATGGATPLSLNSSSNNSTSSSLSAGAAPSNNNNSSSVANNNCNGGSDSGTVRPPSLSPSDKTSAQTQEVESPTEAGTPQDGDKPADFSRTAKDLSAVTGEEDGTGRVRACEFCGKKFRFQSNLIVHRRTHTGEKPYKCSVCNHACTQSSKLKRHMKVHRLNRSAGDASANGGSNSTSDHASNAGSVETLEDEDEDDEDEDEDEDDDDEEDMELEDEEGDDDDDLGGDAPEDLTTKSNASTPPNNNNTSAGGDNKGSGSPRPTPASTPMDKVNTSGSLVGELMDKFGLSHIAQYNEAYKQALQESIGAHPLGLCKDDLLHRSPLIVGDNNNIGKLPQPPRGLENGLLDKSAAAMRFREDLAKNMLAAGQPLDLVGGPHSIFSAGAAFDNPFDTANKRLKLELEHPVGPLGRSSDRDNLYAGLWLPAMAAAHHRDALFPGSDAPMDLLNPRSKCGSLSDAGLLKISGNGPKAGPSASSLAAAAAAALNLGLPLSAQQTIKKESRRNDTCEYCGKVFKNCSNLTVHRRSHTGEKPYKCELCSYACAQSSKLTRHMKTHGRLGKDVYRCRFCEMPFSVPSTLEKHMRKCVVNQNKGGLHFLQSMSGDEDSSMSASKEAS